MWHYDYDGGTYSYIDFKKRIIFQVNVFLLWFGSSPSLTPMCDKASLLVFVYRLTRFMNMDSLVGDAYRLFTEPWYLWEASYLFCWICIFVDVLFSVNIFDSYFSLLFLVTYMHCVILAMVGYIPKTESGFRLEVSSLTNITFFFFSIIMHYLFSSWLVMTVFSLTDSYAAAWTIMFLGNGCLTFSWKANIG